MPSQTEYLNKLSQRIEDERPTLDKFENYFTGKLPLSVLTSEVKRAAKVRPLSINYARLILGAVEERIQVEGFRLAPGGEADAGLWDVWQANDLDEQSQLGHLDALLYGRSFLLVWGSGDAPRITVESAKQCIVQRDPATGARVRAVKRWKEDDDTYRATLFLPDQVIRYRTKDSSGLSGWSAEETLDNPFGVVPLIPLVNRPRLVQQDGESELVDAVPLIDAVAKLCEDCMVASEFTSLGRRHATGIEIQEVPKVDEVTGEPVLDENGQPVMEPAPMFQELPRIMLAENPEARFGAFPEASLTGYLEAIKTFTHALATLAGLPPHYVALSATDNPASAEAIRSAEASLVSKARRKMQTWAGAYEEAMRLAMQIQRGSVPDEMQRLETMWKDPETRTVAQAADAALKLVQGGLIPVQQAQEDLGYSPTQIERMRTMRRQDAVDRAVLTLTESTPEKVATNGG